VENISCSVVAFDCGFSKKKKKKGKEKKKLSNIFP
jgi:hypothetical protein